MSEDYTWQDVPVTDVTTLAARVQELEHALAQADANMVALARRNEELVARLDAVPVWAIAYLMADIVPTDEIDKAKQHKARATIIAWLESLEADEDDPDAPLTLAAIDDEDGDL